MDLFCELYCSEESYFHIHCKDHVDEYYGLNLKTSYENVDRQKMTVTQFLPCISCEHISIKIHERQNHTVKVHGIIEPVFECVFKCELASKKPEDVTDHMVMMHKDEIRQHIMERKKL